MVTSFSKVDTRVVITYVAWCCAVAVKMRERERDGGDMPAHLSTDRYDEGGLGGATTPTNQERERERERYSALSLPPSLFFLFANHPSNTKSKGDSIKTIFSSQSV